MGGKWGAGEERIICDADPNAQFNMRATGVSLVETGNV
jgi:hypothetical protein